MTMFKMTIVTCFALSFVGAAFADDVRVETRNDQNVVRTDDAHRDTHRVVHDREWLRHHHHHVDDDHHAPHLDIDVSH